MMTMNLRMAAIASVLQISCGICLAHASNNSVAYQIDAAHDGHVVFKSPFAGPLKQKWVRDLGGSVSYPIVAKGMVFVTVANTGSYGTQMYALNRHTGETVWQKPISGTYFWSNAAYDKGRLFVVNFDGLLQAFAADSLGTPQWAVQLPGQYAFSSPPTAARGQVFLGGAGSGGTLYAVNEDSGAVNWTAGVENGDDSSPALGDGGVYVTYPCQYYKFNLRNGGLIWNTSRGCEGGGGDTPVYHNEHLYVLDWAEGNVVLNSVDGHLEGSLASTVTPAFWENGDKNYELALYNGSLNAIDTVTGNTVWSFAGDGQLSIAPVIINDSVVAGSASGNLYLLDAASGVTLWSTNVGAAIQRNGCCTGPNTGFGAADGMLVVPATNLLAAYVQKH